MWTTLAKGRLKDPCIPHLFRILSVLSAVCGFGLAPEEPKEPVRCRRLETKGTATVWLLIQKHASSDASKGDGATQFVGRFIGIIRRPMICSSRAPRELEVQWQSR